jgi:hypothetical protein
MYDILKKLQNLTPADAGKKSLVESKESKPTNVDVMESKFRQFLESEEKAKKDYDGDGKIESEKDEVWGSRLKAAGKKVKEGYDLPGYGDEATWGGRTPYDDDDYYYCGQGEEQIEAQVEAPYDIPEIGVRQGETFLVDVYVDCQGDDFTVYAVGWGNDDEFIDLERAGQSWVDRIHDSIIDKLSKDAPDHDLDETNGNITEKSKSPEQQRLFGMVHAAQQGEKPASKTVAKLAKTMSKQDVTDFAKTKHTGLKKHVKESRVMEAHSTFDHIIQRYPAEVKQFERTQQLDDDLYDALYDYYRNAGEMPYAVAKARSGDPKSWISEKFARDIGIGTQTELPFNDELDEIAQLAGLNSIGQEPVMDENFGQGCLKTQVGGYLDGEVEEGNEFSGALAAAKASHQKEFNVNGKTYPVKEDEMEEGNEFSGALAAARASGQKEFEVDGKQYTVKEDVNLNITANGEQDAVNLIRKLSGLSTIEMPQEEPCPCQDDITQSGLNVIELPVDEDRDIEYTNTPREKVAPIGAAYPSGTDLHKAKKSYSDRPYRGDNPMADRRVEETLWKKYSSMLKGLTK